MGIFGSSARDKLQKFVDLKFEFFSFNTFDVSQIVWQRVAQPRPKYSYCILLNWIVLGFCLLDTE